MRQITLMDGQGSFMEANGTLPDHSVLMPIQSSDPDVWFVRSRTKSTTNCSEIDKDRQSKFAFLSKGIALSTLHAGRTC